MPFFLFPVKWNNVLTERVRSAGLEREAEEALYCPQCLPSCNDVQYRISMSVLPIDNYLATLASSANNTTEFSSDISVLRVFFGEPHAHLYTRLLNNEWFEIFSEYWVSSSMNEYYRSYFPGTIGNILSIFMGFSLVAIFETLFFFLKYIYMGCWRIIEHSRTSKLDARKLQIYP